MDACAERAIGVPLMANTLFARPFARFEVSPSIAEGQQNQREPAKRTMRVAGSRLGGIGRLLADYFCVLRSEDELRGSLRNVSPRQLRLLSQRR